MAERFCPRIGDAVWVEGHNPAWYGNDDSRYMNAEVINLDRNGAIVLFWDTNDTDHLDNDYFTDKEYHPDDAGWGVWKIHY